MCRRVMLSAPLPSAPGRQAHMPPIDRAQARPPRRRAPWVMAAGLCLLAVCVDPAFAAGGVEPDARWWVWPLALFVVSFLLGIVAIPAGVGGGILFVPIVGGFFPFHLDFVRGAGLLVALAGALSAGPKLLRAGLADLRLGLPLALLASASSISPTCASGCRSRCSHRRARSSAR
jgi:uncharacterized protein